MHWLEERWEGWGKKRDGMAVDRRGMGKQCIIKQGWKKSGYKKDGRMEDGQGTGLVVLETIQ